MALTSRFDDALTWAAALHREQRRKGSRTPYVGHLLGVAAVVIEEGGSEDEAIAALLHDAAEDQGGRERLDDIAARFGAGVAAIVEACSDAFSAAERDGAPWRPRKERHLARLEGEGPSALRVTLADKLYNLHALVADYRTLGEAVWARFKADADHPWYFAAVLDLLRRRLPGPRVEELAAALAELHRLLRDTPHPIDDSYWLSPGRLLAGEYPGAARDDEARRKLRRLAWSGVDVFLDLTEPGEYGLRPYAPLLPAGAVHRRMPIADQDVPDPDGMRAILDALGAALADGRVVYLHCFGGIGRTGTVAGCWLVEQGLSGGRALEHIAALRAGTPDGGRRSPETDEQLALVLGWAGGR
jgi:hypothetical protein